MTSDIQILEYNNACDNLQRINELIARFQPVPGHSKQQTENAFNHLLALQEQACDRVKSEACDLLKLGQNEKTGIVRDGLNGGPYSREKDGTIRDYKEEISFERALDELHDAAHEHKAHPSRATKKRLNEAEKNLYKAKVDFAGENVRNIRDGRKGIDANPAKWKKYWDTITRGKVHKKGAIIKALKKAHAKITSPAAFARALEERFG